MPSSEVRYQRGDHYRSYDDDLLRTRRSSSSASSVPSAFKRPSGGKHFGSSTSAENAAVRQQVNAQPYHRQEREREFLTKKKVEVKTTKNTEKRVQRCIVLEDGRIIEHDEPHIVVDTIEDTQTHEFDHLEDEALARELQASIERSYAKAGIHPTEHEARRKSLAYASRPKDHRGNSSKEDMISKNVVRSALVDLGEESGSIVDDTFKRIVSTHDVRENIVRTHAAKDLGVISRKGLRKVLNKQGKVSDYIKYDEDYARGKSKSKALVSRYQTDSRKKTVDTEDTHKISRRMRNGQVKTETVRTEKHEIFDDRAAPDDCVRESGSSETEHERDEQQFKMMQTQEFTDYYDTKGNLLMHGPNLVSKDTKVVMSDEALQHFGKWAELSEDRIRQARQSMKKRLRPAEDAERTDALTKKPLNLDKEEKTRKKETDKWLERHFGSDWSLMHNFSAASSSGGGGGRYKYLDSAVNVSSGGSQFDPTKVRRTMSFSSIPVFNSTHPGERVSRVVKQTTTTIRPGFDKHVVSSITKSHVPQDAREAERPYHSTLTLATHGQPLQDKKPHHFSTQSLSANETSHMTVRKVPITRVQDEGPKRRSRVQRLIEENRSVSNRSSDSRSKRAKDQHRHSYYFGEDLHARVHSEPPKRLHDVANNSNNRRERPPPLYRTELLKTSNRLYADGYSETESMVNRRNWRNELSQSYNDISYHNELSRPIHQGSPLLMQKDVVSHSYCELPKPSKLFGWSDEFNLNGYGGHRSMERSEGIRTHHTMRHHGDKIQRSKSFAAVTSNSSDKSSSSIEASYHIFGGSKKLGSYKKTKVSKTPTDHFFPTQADHPIVGPPKEFAGLSTDIQHCYDEAKTKLSKPNIKHHHRMNKSGSDAVYEFERKIPMQSSILEAQKFKTVIFVSGC